VSAEPATTPVLVDPAPPGGFGPLVTAFDIEMAVLELVAKWFDTYLVELERRRGWPLRSQARPKSLRVTSEWERMPEDQLPAIIVSSPGTSDFVPMSDGRGLLHAEWQLGLGAVVSTRSAPPGYVLALRKARDWAALLRWIAIQQRDDSGVLGSLDWVGERYDTIDADSDRTICLGNVLLRCVVGEVAQKFQGPMEPLAPPEDPDVPPPVPSPQWPIATDVDVTVDKVPLDEEVQ